MNAFLFICRTVSQQFGIAISTAHDTVERFVNVVLEKVMPMVIKIPTEDTEFRQLANGFYQYHYPNVIGAIDGSGIDITAPANDKLDYFTRKYRTSVNLTAVCDSRKRFWNINVGNSERCHDSHIFRCSPLGKMLLAENAIPSQYHLIGDAAYGLHVNVITPYGGCNLTDHQQLHNNRHSSTRMVIERAFGDLKGRWLRLQSLRCNVELAVKVIAVCCTLHNICIDFGDIQPSEHHTYSRTGSYVINTATASGKRDAITMHLVEHNDV